MELRHDEHMERHIPMLKEAIRINFGCEGRYVATETVTKVHEQRIIWQGEVAIFDVEHPSGATKVYAWPYANLEGDLQTAYMTILGLPPVESADDAVTVAICAAAAD